MREYEHVHTDCLEIFAEVGASDLGLFLGVLRVCAYRTLRVARARKERNIRALTAGCVAGCLSLLIHEVFDFNFQIPANASTFVFILAMGLVAALFPRSRT